MRNGAYTLPNATFDARRRGVLAFTCAAHLLALFLWTQERRLLPVRPSRAVTILLQTDRAQPARPPLDADMHLLPVPSMPVAPNTDARSAQGGFVAGLAKQQAGRVDRELRKGKSGVPTEADTPAARFQRGVESAYIDRTLTWQSDTYTSPDGVVIYRFRQGNRVRCRRAGGVGMPLAGMPGTGSITAASAGAAGATDCPKGVVWNQD
ncbi:hypothetical protein ACEN88_18380 [Massilia sp. CT11-108]|uniref:hypothetical protein n=1 Tax=Massilia sp. CT11-108 TaxID=3393900 RepID=UPI0039A401C6